MRNHLINELTAIAKKDKDVMLIAGDLGFGVLNEFMETLPDQFINAGICEQNMASVAAGLALEGRKESICVFHRKLSGNPMLRAGKK